MSLLFPAFLAAAAAAAVPIVLHLLRINPRRIVPFPSLRFLGREALRDVRRYRISRWLILLLRCLAIAMLATAFARPYWPLAHTGSSRSVVVLVDNSYSVQAAGRRAALEAWLAPHLATLRPPDRLGVLLLQPIPRWLAPLSPDLAAGRAAVHPLPAGFEASHFGAGLEVAAAALRSAPTARKEILLASDEQRLGWDDVSFRRTLPPGIELVAAPAAPPPKRQAAVVGVSALRTDDGRLSLQVTVRGFAPASDVRTATFYANGRKLGERRLAVVAGQLTTVAATFRVPDFGARQAIRVSLDPDDLPADDSAYTVLSRLNGRGVMLSPERDAGGAARDRSVDFLRRALAAVRGAGLPALRLQPVPRQGPWPESAVAVLRGAEPFGGNKLGRLDAFVAAGGSVWVLCDGSAAQAAWLERHGARADPEPVPAGGLKLGDVALDHPLFAPFAKDSVFPLFVPTFRRAWKLSGENAEPLARWGDGAIAIAEVPTAQGRILATGFGDTRADSNLPVTAAFVPFAYQAVSWLAQQSANPPGAVVGERLPLAGAGTWSPVGAPAAEAVDGSVVPTAPGLYRFAGRDGTDAVYPVNLDTAESDLAPWPDPAEFSRLEAPAPSAAAAPPPGDTPSAGVWTWLRGMFVSPHAGGIDPRLVDERHAWSWLLLGALVVLLAEMALSNRTVR